MGFNSDFWVSGRRVFIFLFLTKRVWGFGASEGKRQCVFVGRKYKSEKVSEIGLSVCVILNTFLLLHWCV